MRFLHLADVHLGNQQYNSPDRYNDFYLAFEKAIDLAIDSNVSACIIAGDLFHKSSLDPLTLAQADKQLARLKSENIRTLMIAGNHDKVRYRDDHYSWLHYLQDHDLIQMLEPTHTDDGMRLEPERGYTDIDGIRFMSIPWCGSSIRKVLQQEPEALEQLPWDDIDFSTLMLHGAVEGMMPDQPDCMLLTDLEPLRQRVDYLALGHLHKPYEVEGWIYNPGSLESCSVDEANYDKGAYLVETGEPKTAVVKRLKTTSRPFLRLTFPTDSYLDPQALMSALRDFIFDQCEDRSYPILPVVRLTLRGNLSFDRTQLDIQAMVGIIREAIECLTVDVKLESSVLGLSFEGADDLPREILELQIFEELVKADSRYSAHAPAWAGIIRDIKQMALDRVEPKVIYETLDLRIRSL